MLERSKYKSASRDHGDGTAGKTDRPTVWTSGLLPGHQWAARPKNTPQPTIISGPRVPPASQKCPSREAVFMERKSLFPACNKTQTRS